MFYFASRHAALILEKYQFNWKKKLNVGHLLVPAYTDEAGLSILKFCSYKTYKPENTQPEITEWSCLVPFGITLAFKNIRTK